MSGNRIFVYGTLKQNQPNHHLIENTDNGCAKFLGNGTTQETFPLVIASRYNIPYVLPAQGKGKNVEGEVYEVDDKMLNKMDQLEDHPHYYQRKLKKIKLKSGEELECWIYLLIDFKPHLLDLPYLTSYNSEADPKTPYIPKYLREKPGPEYWTDVKNTDLKN